jgi:peptide/nickel transport system ATP-binding protein
VELDFDTGGDPAEPPRVVDPSPGCRFRDRCPLVEDVCRHVDPVPVPLEPGHAVACHVAAPAARSEGVR